MAKLVDLTGHRYFRLTVIERIEGAKHPSTWRCICDCGREKIAIGNSMRRGLTKSCGCLHYENGYTGNRRHGLWKSPTYVSWQNMRARCLNKNNPNYPYYGALGISVCARWDSFEIFLQDMGDRPKGTTLDRKDNSLGYAPDNCRWANGLEQRMNQGRGSLTESQVIEIRRLSGMSKNGAEIGRMLGIPSWAVQRVRRGQTFKTIGA